MAYIPVADSEEVPEGAVKRYEIDGKSIALARYQGEFYAFSDTCTHAEASLCEGLLEGKEVECPLHGARFDITSGAALCAPAFEDLEVYSVRISGRTIEVDL